MTRRVFLPWTLMMPLGLFLMIVGLYVVQQVFYGWAFKQQVARLIDDDQPIDLRSLDKRGFQLNSHSQTVERQALSLSYWSSTANQFAISSMIDQFDVSEMSTLGLPLPGSEWPEKPLLLSYLKENQCLIRQLDNLSGSAEPTWRPSTPLGVFVNIPGEMLLCDAEFLIAYHENDADRALKALCTGYSVVLANDVQMDCGQDTSRIQAVQPLLVRVIQSLETPDFWSNQQLIKLSSLIKEKTSIKERWRNAITGERARRLEGLTRDSGRLLSSILGEYTLRSDVGFEAFISNTDKYNLLLNYNRAMALADDGYGGLQDRASHQESDIRPWFSLRPLSRNRYQPPFDPIAPLSIGTFNYADRLVTLENFRRLAAVGIALRRYGVQHNRWPTNLTELTRLDVDPNDLRDVEQQAWPYEIANDGAVEISYSYGHDPSSLILLRMQLPS